MCFFIVLNNAHHLHHVFEHVNIKMSNNKMDLSERVAALEQEKRTSEEEFGRQRKKFMHHMMESDGMSEFKKRGA